MLASLTATLFAALGPLKEPINGWVWLWFLLLLRSGRGRNTLIWRSDHRRWEHKTQKRNLRWMMTTCDWSLCIIIHYGDLFKAASVFFGKQDLSKSICCSLMLIISGWECLIKQETYLSIVRYLLTHWNPGTAMIISERELQFWLPPSSFSLDCHTFQN